jgi:hypothetical protein
MMPTGKWSKVDPRPSLYFEFGLMFSVTHTDLIFFSLKLCFPIVEASFLFCFRMRQTNIHIRHKGSCEENSTPETVPAGLLASVSTLIFIVMVLEVGSSVFVLLHQVMLKKL